VRATTGIDTFEDTVLHENHHTVQIAGADTMVTIAPGGPWRFGWSWNQGASHNHWTVGPDGRPGVATVDDDGDGTADNLLVTGPGELGRAGSDDVLLHVGGAQQWPPALGAMPSNMPPNCWAGGSAIEDAAYDQEPDSEDARLGVDWAAPGKQHRTRSAVD
jgi:hypothetical protein